MNEKIRQAFLDMMQAHKDDTRKYNEIPYVLHPIEVYEILKLVTDDEDVLCAGLLHDVYEDHPESYSLTDLSKKYGKKVASIVEEVSKDPETQEFHIRSREGLLVKLADMMHNISDCPDTEYISKKIEFINDKIIWKTDCKQEGN